MGETSSDTARTSFGGKRPVVAIVSKQRIIGATNGSSAYLLSLARSMREVGCDVHLIQPSPDIAGRTPIFAVRPEMDVFARHTIRGSLRFGNRFLFADPTRWRDAALGVATRMARSLGVRAKWASDRPRPYAVATPWKGADLRFVERNLAPETVALVADYMFCAPAFGVTQTGLPTGIVMHDLFHARDGGTSDSVALVERQQEIDMLASADAVFTIQQDESRFVADNVPDTAAILAPMPAFPAARSQPGSDLTVLFIGSNTAPNSVGLRAFLADVWPRILDVCPDCELTVAGTVDRAFAGETFANVRFLGMVDDLDRLYREAGVVISPLTFGSGLKIKLIEGLAQGKAMVVSSVTLQGVEESVAPAVCCADDAQTVAQALIALVANSAAREGLGDAALACAKAHFSADNVHRSLREWVASGISRHPSFENPTQQRMRDNSQ